MTEGQQRDKGTSRYVLKTISAISKVDTIDSAGRTTIDLTSYRVFHC